MPSSTSTTTAVHTALYPTGPHPQPATTPCRRPCPGDSRDPETHDRIRHDRVDKAGSVTLRHNGRLHHIGIGRTHAGTCVILLVQDLKIRVVNTITGELIRELTLNPHIDYQPTGAPKGPTRNPKMTTAGPAVAGPAVSDVLRHHICSGGSVLVQDIGNRCLKT